MTGSVTILGGKVAKLVWDTDSPVSVEEARHAFDTAIGAGGQAFDSTAEEAVRIDHPHMHAPGVAESDVTVVPRYAGG